MAYWWDHASVNLALYETPFPDFLFRLVLGESSRIVLSRDVAALFLVGRFIPRWEEARRRLLIWRFVLGVQVGRSYRHYSRHFHGNAGLEHPCRGSAPGGCCVEPESVCRCPVHHDLPSPDYCSLG